MNCGKVFNLTKEAKIRLYRGLQKYNKENNMKATSSDIFKQLCNKYPPHIVLIAAHSGTKLTLNGKSYKFQIDPKNSINNKFVEVNKEENHVLS